MRKPGWLLVGFVIAGLPLVLPGAPAGRSAPTPARPARGLSGTAPHRPYRLLFPHLVDGPRGDLAIRSRILLTNRSGYTASGQIRLLKTDGEPWSLRSSLGTGARFEFVIEPDAILRLDFEGGQQLAEGWAEVRSDRELAGAGIFLVSDRSGATLSETGFSDSLTARGQQVFFQSGEEIETALALCNPSEDRQANLHFSLMSLDGRLVTQSDRTLSPRSQSALLVRELFPTGSPGPSGVLLIESDEEIAALTLRTRGTSFTSLPAVPVSPTGPSHGTELVFPRIGEGVFGDLAFETSFLLLNPSESPVEAEIEFYTIDGDWLDLTLQGIKDHHLTVAIPARGAVVWTGEAPDREGVIGWARVKSSARLGGTATFLIRDALTGRYLSEVGVPDSPVSPGPEISVVESSDATTGLGLTNPSDEDLMVRLLMLPDNTAVPRVKTLRLPARSHLGRFVPELFPDLPPGEAFEGRIKIDAFVDGYGEDVPAGLSSMALLARSTGLTSLPASVGPLLPLPLSAWDPQVSETLSGMTLEEKVGQMTLPDMSYLRDEADIANYFLGGVLSGGDSDPPGGNSRLDWTEQYNRYQSRAQETRLRIPLLYGVDAVHGHSNVEGAVIFPHNIGLGATRDARLVERVARVTAAEVRATGVNWTYSPCLAVPRDERWGRTYEGFGEEPDLVRELAAAAVRGYQGAHLNDPRSLVACAKHFLADGGTVWGTGNPIDQGDARISEAELRAVHLPGYLAAIQAGVASVMASFSSWNGVKMSGNHYLLTEVLKGELGFEGFLLSDWGAIDQFPGDYRSDVRTSINSGLDMIMVPDRYREFFQTLKSLVESGEVPISRIDDAVRRILRVKFASGLFESRSFSDPGLTDRFGSRPHRELARQAVRESMVLLQNQGGLLPLSKTAARVLVTGRNADDLGNQCGGWTIDWQGSGGRPTQGTTILEAVRATVSPTTEVIHSPDGSGAENADFAIVVVGETPYAEFVGDSEELSLSDGDKAVLERVRQAGCPTVLVVVSGRPLILGEALEHSDAVVAAWLPGSEGQGVADVLFGDYRPTGRLPCSWPRTASQIPVNVGDLGYDPLFPYGFGLSY